MAPYNHEQDNNSHTIIDNTKEEDDDDDAFALLEEHEYIKIRDENDRLYHENRNLKHIVKILRKITTNIIHPDTLNQFLTQQLEMNQQYKYKETYSASSYAGPNPMLSIYNSLVR